MGTATTTSPSCRAGISLLEVLISMFILAVGIVSVLSLFTAGREIRARTAIISRSVSFADQMATTVDGWRDLSEWQFWNAGPGPVRFEWVDGPAGTAVQLPVVIDPYGLNLNAARVNPNGWDWPNFADVRGGLAPGAWQSYFRRITFPSVPRTVNPANPPESTLAFEEVITLFSDADAVEYRLPTSPSLPPENVVEFGRRKRAGDLSPALMIARQDWQSAAPATEVPMRYWLLVSHKQPRGYDNDRNETNQWPQGSVKFDVTQLADGLIELSLPTTRKPDDGASVRRGLQPGRWLLLTRWNGTGWVIHWTKMTSVTKGDNPDTWLVVPERPPEPDSTWAFTSGGPSPPLAFSFDSLVHVQELTSLAGEKLN